MSDTVTITKQEYQQLLKDQLKLECLENCGVDNWQGWDDAMDMMREAEERTADTEKIS